MDVDSSRLLSSKFIIVRQDVQIHFNVKGDTDSSLFKHFLPVLECFKCALPGWWCSGYAYIK